MNTPIYTPNAPAAIGPYSQAVQTGNMLFVSGQIPIDPATGEFEALDRQIAYDEVNKKWVKVEDGQPEAVDYAFASDVHDYWEMDDVNNPENSEVSKRLFMKLRDYKEKMMKAGTTMVPRVFKTNVGDHYTTNLIHAAPGSLKEFDLLAPRAADGILEPVADMSGDMVWQVAKVYTMPDHQAGVKVIRIK